MDSFYPSKTPTSAQWNLPIDFWQNVGFACFKTLSVNLHYNVVLSFCFFIQHWASEFHRGAVCGGVSVLTTAVRSWLTTYLLLNGQLNCFPLSTNVHVFTSVCFSDWNSCVLRFKLNAQWYPVRVHPFHTLPAPAHLLVFHPIHSLQPSDSSLFDFYLLETNEVGLTCFSLSFVVENDFFHIIHLDHGSPSPTPSRSCLPLHPPKLTPFFLLLENNQTEKPKQTNQNRTKQTYK